MRTDEIKTMWAPTEMQAWFDSEHYYTPIGENLLECTLCNYQVSYDDEASGLDKTICTAAAVERAALKTSH